MRGEPLEIPFPLGGLDETFGFQDQQPFTTPSASNVRGHEAETGRARGGTRSGHTSLGSAGGAVQDLIHVSTAVAPSSSTSVATRATKLIAVGGGTASIVVGTGSGGGGLSGSRPAIFSAVLNGKVYWVDGTQKRVYDANTDTMSNWVASPAGTFPHNGANLPTLIERYRGRVVLAGVKGDDHNYFACKLDDPTNFDYSPDPHDETAAFAGNNSESGLVGDIIRSLVPFSDDSLLFGCDHSLWMMRGDIQAGGRVDLINETIGMPWGRPWTKDPSGSCYFMASQGGIYRIDPDGGLKKISKRTIDERLADLDLDETLVRMGWNDRENGVHIYLTHLAGESSTHYFFDVTNSAWWPDSFGSSTLNPTCAYMFDGDDPEDRALIVGTRGGQVLSVDPDATSDAGTSITSHVDIGPIRMGGPLRAAILTELQAVLANDSGNVTATIRVGDAPETAFNATAWPSMTWTEGRNPSNVTRAHGAALYLKLSGTSPWQLESVAARLREVGAIRQRMRI